MPLLIRTTGLEEYAPGGAARVKVLVIGGPGAGKTRWASYFPKPIYADSERGMASVADRKVPYVTINSSEDMLDLLTMLKQECQQPAERRRFETIVIDTLDAFQRKIKNEWMEKEKKQTFSGWEAWGYLNSRMQMLMTRLLNLDMNVIVNVHYKDKVTKDDETGRATHELMLQLQGETADTAFNDFDLVGWMGTYWQAVDGVRVQKRGLTFKPTPEKPFLKDRLHITPEWLQVEFAAEDYDGLFRRVQEKIEELDAGTVIGEVLSASDQPPSTGPGVIVTPGALGSGPVAGAATATPKLTYNQMDKPTLSKLIRDRNITTTTDGTPLRGNTLKSELIAALEAHDAAPAAPAPPAEPTPTKPSPEPVPAVTEPAETPAAEPAPAQSVANPARTKAVEGVGKVDTDTGEITDEAEHQQAVTTVTDQLGGTVLASGKSPEPSVSPETDAKPEATCQDCGKPLEGENTDFVKLAWIKYRRRLCEDDYRKRKSGR